MRRAVLAATVLLCVTTLGACSTGRPPYAQVREEAVGALTTIVDLIPHPLTVDAGSEQEPYSCSDRLMVSQGEGWFYTGHWIAEVPADFDVTEYIETLPRTLGDGWREEDLGIDVSFATVDLVQESTGVSIAVEDHSEEGRRVIDILAISRCGVLSDDDRSPEPTPLA